MNGDFPGIVKFASFVEASYIHHISITSPKMFAELFSASTEPTERSPLRLFCSEPPLRKIEQEEEKIRKEIKVLISDEPIDWVRATS